MTTTSIRAGAIQGYRKASNMKVYTMRNLDDDGDVFCAAKNKTEASNYFIRWGVAPKDIGRTVELASRSQLESIAARALLMIQ